MQTIFPAGLKALHQARRDLKEAIRTYLDDPNSDRDNVVALAAQRAVDIIETIESEMPTFLATDPPLLLQEIELGVALSVAKGEDGIRNRIEQKPSGFQTMKFRSLLEWPFFDSEQQQRFLVAHELIAIPVFRCLPSKSR